MKVKKAVIPAAGLGAKFSPATKAMAKEMLPVVDKPTIQFIVEEVLKSGIENILIVTGKAERPIEDHFDSNIELGTNLSEKGKTELLKLVEKTTDVNLYFIRQSHPKGLGHAILQARAFIGNEPFVVMLGDDIMEDEVSLIQQLIDDYERTHTFTIAVMQVPHDETSEYGVISPGEVLEDGLHNVKNFAGKPDPSKAPSDLAIIGRYLLTPEIFDVLLEQQPGAGNEIQLTDAIDTLNKTQRVFARKFTGKRYNVGDKFGFMKTSIGHGLTHPEVRAPLREYIMPLDRTLEAGGSKIDHNPKRITEIKERKKEQPFFLTSFSC